MQTLYYIPASSSLERVPEAQDVPSDYWYDISSLVTSASLYQIIAFSGSTPVAYFPIDNTNVYLPPFPGGPILPTSPTILGYATWIVTANAYTANTEVYLKDSSSAFPYISSSVNEPNSGFSTFFSGSLNYYMRGSGSAYTASIAIKNLTTANTFTSNSIGVPLTGTYVLNSGSADYQVTMSLTYQVETVES